MCECKFEEGNSNKCYLKSWSNICLIDGLCGDEGMFICYSACLPARLPKDVYQQTTITTHYLNVKALHILHTYYITLRRTNFIQSILAFKLGCVLIETNKIFFQDVIVKQKVCSVSELTKSWDVNPSWYIQRNKLRLILIRFYEQLVIVAQITFAYLYLEIRLNSNDFRLISDFFHEDIKILAY